MTDTFLRDIADLLTKKPLEYGKAGPSVEFRLFRDAVSCRHFVSVTIAQESQMVEVPLKYTVDDVHKALLTAYGKFAE